MNPFRLLGDRRRPTARRSPSLELMEGRLAPTASLAGSIASVEVAAAPSPGNNADSTKPGGRVGAVLFNGAIAIGLG